MGIVFQSYKILLEGFYPLFHYTIKKYKSQIFVKNLQNLKKYI